jgi:hypothetical protein
MYKEYDQLRNKYDLDTGALQQAITRASQVNKVVLNTNSVLKFLKSIVKFDLVTKIEIF